MLDKIKFEETSWDIRVKIDGYSVSKNHAHTYLFYFNESKNKLQLNINFMEDSDLIETEPRTISGTFFPLKIVIKRQ